MFYRTAIFICWYPQIFSNVNIRGVDRFFLTNFKVVVSIEIAHSKNIEILKNFGVSVTK